jgi:hypothetical protein
MGGRSRAARLSLGALAALSLPAAALAATLNVNSTSSAYVAGDGLCTLYEAVDNANANVDTTAGDCAAGSGADLINVPAGTYFANLHIDSDLTLRGAGASLTVVDADGGWSVVEVSGAGIVVTLERLTLTGAEGSGSGGVVSLYGTTLTLSECIVSGNSGEFGFGGCPIIGPCSWSYQTTGGVFSLGTTTIRRSAVVNNSGPGISAWGPLRVENSTISGNDTGGSFSCGCFNGHCGCTCVGGVAAAVSGNGSLLNSTVTDNECGPSCTTCGPTPAISGSVISQGSVIANPVVGNCSGALVTSSGHNLDSDGSCGFTDPTDLSNVDPLLGPLQGNGGPTPTHALQLGSPAIDAIPSAACTWDHDGDPGTPEVKLTKDQRGGMRPREGNGGAPNGCDIGAYEVAPCADGLDNDGDGLVDFDGGATAGLTPLASPDPTCAAALGAAEVAPPSTGCGVGPELLLLGPLLAAVRRRPSSAAPHPRREA